MTDQHSLTSEEQIQFTGRNLAERLDSLVNSGGDANSTVQALELFVKAVMRDVLEKLGVVK